MKVLIADDHPLVCDALLRTVLCAEALAEVVSVGCYDGIVDALEHDTPALALVDLNMPGMDGVAGVRRLRQRYPELPLAVASGQDDSATVRAVADAGAIGFLPKCEPAEVLVRALRLMLSGCVCFPRGVMTAPSHPDAEHLTPRQRDVLRLLMRGEPNKVIARQLTLTEGTVKIHIAAILRTLQARNRTEAVVFARELGVV